MWTGATNPPGTFNSVPAGPIARSPHSLPSRCGCPGASTAQGIFCAGTIVSAAVLAEADDDRIASAAAPNCHNFMPFLLDECLAVTRHVRQSFRADACRRTMSAGLGSPVMKEVRHDRSTFSHQGQSG